LREIKKEAQADVAAETKAVPEKKEEGRVGGKHKSKGQARLYWTLGVIAVYGLSFVLCRYVLFGLHGMKDWPDILAVAGAVVLLGALATGRRALSVMTVVGYLGGFATGMLFGVNGMDPGGGRTNNGWLIWMLAMLLCIAVGVLLSVVQSSLRKRRQQRQKSRKNA